MASSADTLEFLFGAPNLAARFSSVEQLWLRPLKRAEVFSATLLADPAFRRSVDALRLPLECAVFGWIDQAVFEIAYCATGDQSVLSQTLSTFDSYRPDQNGDLALAVGRPEWSEAVLVQVSFDSGFMELHILHRAA
jgi:hypothetical protein